MVVDVMCRVCGEKPIDPKAKEVGNCCSCDKMRAESRVITKAIQELGQEGQGYEAYLLFRGDFDL